MFDVRNVGKKIMTLRKGKNLTQMALADAIGVSFQAVSNWERGNSMPDISKLPELAELFEISIDDLLGHVEETEVVKNIVLEKEVTVEEIKSVGPIIKPKDMDNLCEETDDHFDFSKIVDMAPFVSSEYLESLLDRIDLRDQSNLILELMPFLSDKYLDQKAKVYAEVKDIDAIISLAPFLSNKTLEHVMSGIGGSADMSELFPFISSKAIARIIDDILSETHDYDMLNVAPFLTSKQLEEIILNHPEIKFDVSELYPFMSTETIHKITDAWLKRQGR